MASGIQHYMLFAAGGYELWFNRIDEQPNEYSTRTDERESEREWGRAKKVALKHIKIICTRCLKSFIRFVAFAQCALNRGDDYVLIKQ